MLTSHSPIVKLQPRFGPGQSFDSSRTHTEIVRKDKLSSNQNRETATLGGRVISDYGKRNKRKRKKKQKKKGRHEPDSNRRSRRNMISSHAH